MKYNISIDPDDFFNREWRRLAINGTINVVILHLLHCDGIQIEIIGYSDHLCEYEEEELVDQFFDYAFGYKIPNNINHSPRVAIRYNYDFKGKRAGVLDFMLRIIIRLDQLDHLPDEISTAILMNLPLLAV